jgi:hypothetical protein
MSQWGKLDRNVIPGTVIANLGSKTVVTSQDQSANVKIGWPLVLGNVEYVVANVVNGTTFTLDVMYEGANTQGAPSFIAVQQSPKNYSTYGWGANAITGNQAAENRTDARFGANTVNSRNVYGVDIYEAMSAQNKQKGISHTGWVHYQTWVNTQGTTRNRAEVLVAMSKNFNRSNVDFNIGLDANDDAVLADLSLYFTQTPRVNGRAANAQFTAVSYSVAANSTLGTQNSGAVLSYKWQKSPNAIVWTDVIDLPYAGNAQFSGNTTANLYISNVYATITTVNIYIRAIVTANAAANLISDPIQIYVGQSQ